VHVVAALMQQDTEVMQCIDVIRTLVKNRTVTALRIGQTLGLVMIQSSGEWGGKLIHGGLDQQSR